MHVRCVIAIPFAFSIAHPPLTQLLRYENEVQPRVRRLTTIASKTPPVPFPGNALASAQSATGRAFPLQAKMVDADLPPPCLLLLPAPLQIARKFRLAWHLELKLSCHHPVDELVSQAELRARLLKIRKEDRRPGSLRRPSTIKDR